METGPTTEASLCTYDFDTHILTTPCDKAQEGVLSDVRSLPFFQDVLAEKLAASARKENKKAYTTLKIVSNLAALTVSKLCMARMRGSTIRCPSQVLNCAQVPRPLQPTP
jgi:hypothetical protein